MPSERATILVVEDEAAQRELIADALERAGHAVRRAPSVDGALEALEESVPELVLCDWRMPGRSGGDLLAEVRSRG